VSLQIDRVTDAEGAAGYHQIEAETVPVDHPGLIGDSLDDVVGMVEHRLPSFDIALYVAREGDEVVAHGFFGLPMVENQHMCHVYVAVALDARRRGIGTELANFLLAEGRREGRSLLVSYVLGPLDGRAPGDALAAKLGAKPALEQVRRQLVVSQLDSAELASRVEALATGPAAAYELITWQDRCPDEIVDGAAQIVPLVQSDSPQGELEMEDEVWDAPRFREFEEFQVARGRSGLSAAAIERSSGRLVAMTNLALPSSDHRVVDQQGTAVERAHRGHRLGLLIKGGNLLNLLTHFPDAATIQTYNAAANEHMIAVNEALGFRAVERETAYQLAL
jgi:GNAT superfamily N-acetyltransferase